MVWILSPWLLRACQGVCKPAGEQVLEMRTGNGAAHRPWDVQACSWSSAGKNVNEHNCFHGPWFKCVLRNSPLHYPDEAGAQAREPQEGTLKRISSEWQSVGTPGVGMLLGSLRCVGARLGEAGCPGHTALCLNHRSLCPCLFVPLAGCFSTHPDPPNFGPQGPQPCTNLLHTKNLGHICPATANPFEHINFDFSKKNL